MEVNGAAGREPLVNPLGQQGAEDAAQHVAGAALGHGRAAGRVDAHIPAPADQGAAALQDQDRIRVLRAKAQGARKSSLAQIAAQALEFPLVRGEKQGRAAACEQLRLPGEGRERVRVQDQGTGRLTQDGPNQRLCALSRPETGADDAGARLVELFQNLRQGLRGDLS